MATNVAGLQAQEYHTNQTHFIVKKIDYLTVDGATVEVGVLPPNAAIVGGGVVVTTAFNDTSGNVLDVGFSGGDADEYGSDLALGAIGTVVFDDLASSRTFSTSARTVTAAGTLTGDGPTAGVGYVYVEYIIIRTP